MRLNAIALGCLVVAGASGALAAEPSATMFDWSGFYVGANGGYGLGTQTNTNSSTTTDGTLFGVPGAYVPPQTFAGPDTTDDMSGWFGGVQAGYNATFGNFLIGAEADIDASAIEASTRLLGSVAGPTYDSRSRLDWFGTLRARAGVTTDRFLFYGTGGFAFGGGTGHLTVTPGVPPTFSGDPFSATDSQTSVGYAVGAGVEAALTSHLVVRLEYLFLDLGERDYTFVLDEASGSTTSATSAVSENLFRIGLNYKFGQ